MSKEFINGRSVVHQGDGLTNVCAAPDVCKTPGPGGPVPVPYVNVAKDEDLAGGSTSVEIEGHPIALARSFLSTSTGDEPGSAGGLISGRTKGKMGWASYSLDVKVEGQGVVRFLDATQHNGNTYNSAFLQQGGTGLAYGDDPLDSPHCPRCGRHKDEHRLLETPDSRGLALALHAQLMQVLLNQSHLKTLKGRGKNKSGYMIGVLVCRCGDRIFAAMSGMDMLPGFVEAVRQLHQQNPKWTPCGTVDFARMHDSHGMIEDSQAVFAGLSVPAPGGTDDDGRQQNLPGMCAAPKLIQEAQRSGHRPLHMTEVYFSPGISCQVHVDYEANGTLTRASFGDGESTPSCATCQVHTTAMLCGNSDSACNQGKSP